MTAAQHKPGCPALGGFGHGKEPCACGAEEVTAAQDSRAALSAEPVAAPRGWKLVPVDPSVEQINAAHEKGFFRQLAIPLYDAMLAAAPQPAAQERKPFSDEERLRIFEKHFSHDMRQGEFFDEIFIIAEREHGITGESK